MIEFLQCPLVGVSQILQIPASLRPEDKVLKMELSGFSHPVCVEIFQIRGYPCPCAHLLINYQHSVTATSLRFLCPDPSLGQSVSTENHIKGLGPSFPLSAPLTAADCGFVGPTEL